MDKQDCSLKSILLYTITYIVLAMVSIFGANINSINANSHEILKDNIYSETKEVATEEKVNIKKKFIYADVTVISVSGDQSLEQNPISNDEKVVDSKMQEQASSIAKGILDGSIVRNLITNSQFLTPDNRIGMIQFSEDMYGQRPEAAQEANEEQQVVVTSGEEKPEEQVPTIIMELPVQASTSDGEVITLSVEEQNGENIVVQDLGPQLDENGNPINYVRYMDYTATAYCLCQKCTGKTPNSPGYGRTASGYVITPGIGEKIAAVDRSKISLGTHLYVKGLNGAPNYGYTLAADTGGAIKGNRIDLYFDSHQQALQWGRRSVRVFVLPE